MWISYEQGWGWCKNRCHMALSREVEAYEQCEECGRQWQWETAGFWRADLKLDKSVPWECVLVQVVAGHGPNKHAVRKYLATHPGGRKVILSSVSDVLSSAFGFGDAMLEWAVREAIFSILKVFLGADYVEETVRQLERDPITKRKLKIDDLVRRLPFQQQQQQIQTTLVGFAPRLEQARQARHVTRDTAAEIGKRAHWLIQQWIANGESLDHLEDFDWDEEEPAVRKCFEGFERFWRREALRPLAVETIVYSLDWGIAGQLDLMTDDPASQHVVIDWKTGKSVREKFLIQIILYVAMWVQSGREWPSRSYCVRICKETSQLEIVPVYTTWSEYLALLQQAAASLQTYRWLKWSKKYLSQFKREDAPIEDDDEGASLDDEAAEGEDLIRGYAAA